MKHDGPFSAVVCMYVVTYVLFHIYLFFDIFSIFLFIITKTICQLNLIVHFREVLNVSKKLAKEREDMSKDLTRLKDRIQEIHSSILGDMKNLVPSANRCVTITV